MEIKHNNIMIIVISQRFFACQWVMHEFKEKRSINAKPIVWVVTQKMRYQSSVTMWRLCGLISNLIVTFYVFSLFPLEHVDVFGISYKSCERNQQENYSKCIFESTHLVGYPFNLVIEGIQKVHKDVLGSTKFVYDFFTQHINNETTPNEYAAIIYVRDSLISGITCNKLADKCPKYVMDGVLEFDNVEKLKLAEKYNFDINSEEVFHFHHGLRFAKSSVKDYVRERSFLDIGAYRGDSALVLSQYTNQTIHSFEISKLSYNEYLNNIEKNPLYLKNKAIVNHMGVSDYIGKESFTDTGTGGAGLNVSGNVGETEVVEVTTIDHYVKKHNLNISFIKADVEGIGFKVIKGGIKTILSQQPVLSIAIYHSFEEMFELTTYLKEKLSNYKFEFHNENRCINTGCEVALFGYPKYLDASKEK